MSYVTTVVIFGRYIPDKAQKVLEEGYLESGEGGRHVFFNHLSEYRPAGPGPNPWDLWAGGKGPEADVFGGAFNYLDDKQLLDWLKTVPWYGRVAVLFGHEEQENGFGLHVLGEGSDAET